MLSDALISQLEQANVEPHQWASLAVFLSTKAARTAKEAELLEAALRRSSSASRYVPALAAGASRTPLGGNWFFKFLIDSTVESSLGLADFQRFTSAVVEKLLSDEEIALWLAKVTLDGLGSGQIEALTLAMRDSGKIFDYRNNETLEKRRIIRRYPTGALSEKMALILPSLISCVRKEAPVASPFLVAKSLGFTGGTWDKLSSIPGFHFPMQGEETVETIKACGVAMCVTLGDFNPVDTVLYQLRSATGTIESLPLMVSSIASKQLAVPADCLLLDVRYGQGAFVDSRQAGESFSRALTTVIQGNGVPCIARLTDTPQPGGMSVGNPLEVIEAMAVMGGRTTVPLDERAIAEQKTLVVEFFGDLMQSQFPKANKSHWRELAADRIATGKVLDAYWGVLATHGVSAEIIRRLRAEPEAVLMPGIAPFSILAEAPGILVHVDQRRLGDIVNFDLGAGGTPYSHTIDRSCGLVLLKRLGDAVIPGEPLCYLYKRNGTTPERQEWSTSIRKCFDIRGPKG